MKVVILAGGRGTRLSPHIPDTPKPILEIGGKPIICHVMDIYKKFGFNDFIILLGHRSEEIQKRLEKESAVYKMTFLETGVDTMTGGRILKAKAHLGDTFLLTYADGLCDLSIPDLIKSHEETNKTVTLTAANVQSRFGILESNDKGEVYSFKEKPLLPNVWVNGGFFVCRKTVLEMFEDDSTKFESVLEKLSLQGKLNAFKHKGFWKCMDDFADFNLLNNLWNSDNIPWK